ncbi:MAG: right-handed parallel beta-helix repeat-containing protein [Methanophagales archaeon]|nr:right-handed parallel beta-helix repeat-containing protein [Methanophagales archaeon]
MRWKKYIEDLKNDSEIYELQRRVQQTNRLHTLLTSNTHGLCIDELVGKSTYTKRDLGIEHSMVADETDDGFGIQKAIDRIGCERAPKFSFLEKLYTLFSRAYLGYLYTRRLLGHPKDDIDVGKLLGLEYPIHVGVGILNPGGMVFVPAGTYSITSAITPKDDMILAGAGTATILDADADVTIINGDNANHNRITIRDMKLVGYGSGTGRGICLGFSNTTLYSNVINVRISGCGYNGLQMKATEGTANLSLILNVSVSGCVSSDEFYGSGIRIMTSDYVNLIGCESRENNANGIFFSNTNNYCTIIGCKARLNKKHGIRIDEYSHTNRIIGNIVEWNDVDNTASYDGILCEADYCIMNSNYCKENDRYQINLTSTSSYCAVIGNVVNDAGATGGINNSGASNTVVNNVTV